MSDLIFLLISGSGWAEEMRRRYPLDLTPKREPPPLCDTHGKPKTRLKRRGWRCRECHANRMRRKRAAMSAEERGEARRRARTKERVRRRDPEVMERNRQYQRDLRAARRQA